jgi:HSP20 family molecular chaperone IbpA
MTTRVFTSPLFLGFDHLEQMLERASKASNDGYPPYNIEQVGPNGLRITLAVAGFTMDELQITQEDNQLVIRGRQADDSQGRVFLHRGIAARQFQRSFVLAEGIDVKGAWLDSGLLHIDLARPEPEVRVRTIEIGRAAQAGGQTGAAQSSPTRLRAVEGGG